MVFLSMMSSWWAPDPHLNSPLCPCEEKWGWCGKGLFACSTSIACCLESSDLQRMQYHRKGNCLKVTMRHHFLKVIPAQGVYHWPFSISGTRLYAIPQRLDSIFSQGKIITHLLLSKALRLLLSLANNSGYIISRKMYTSLSQLHLNSDKSSGTDFCLSKGLIFYKRSSLVHVKNFATTY